MNPAAAHLIAFLEPHRLKGYRPGIPRDAQPATIPSLFIDAMEVREKVFVQEQSISAENEFDADDPRACHWVFYVHQPGDTQNPLSRQIPVGTIRAVPFPHDPHPEIGGSYWNGVLKGETGAAACGNVLSVEDRPTSFHDGKELYVKLGRLAVLKEYRGNKVAGLLVKTALSWLSANPSYFVSNLTERHEGEADLSRLGVKPEWRGLVCAHAQEKVQDAWAKWGFHVDEAMGKWCEEGIPHMGMFQRIPVQLQVKPPEIPN